MGSDWPMEVGDVRVMVGEGWALRGRWCSGLLEHVSIGETILSVEYVRPEIELVTVRALLRRLGVY